MSGHQKGMKMVSTDARSGTPAGVRAATSVHKGRAIGLSVLIGAAVAVLWSVQLVDSEIGGTVAEGLLGEKAQQVDLAATTTGLLFAFVTGVAGTFTACNVAVFSAIAPMVDDRVSTRRRLRRPLGIVGWLSLGAVLVSGAYGAIGVLLGSRLPQLSTHTVGRNVPVRLVQSIAVFTVVGLIMVYLGLAAIRVVPDPLGRPAARCSTGCSSTRRAPTIPRSVPPPSPLSLWGTCCSWASCSWRSR
jgi:hypothetical protein